MVSIIAPTYVYTHTLYFCLSHQSTVNRDSLSGSLSCCSCAFQPLRAGQVNKVELGHQCLELGLSDGAGVHAVHLPVLSSSSFSSVLLATNEFMSLSVLLENSNYFITFNAIMTVLLNLFYFCFSSVLTIWACGHTLIWQRWMVKMACERELVAFIWVLAVVRDRAPSFRHCSSCRTHMIWRTFGYDFFSLN